MCFPGKYCFLCKRCEQQSKSSPLEYSPLHTLWADLQTDKIRCPLVYQSTDYQYTNRNSSGKRFDRATYCDSGNILIYKSIGILMRSIRDLQDLIYNSTATRSKRPSSRVDDVNDVNMYQYAIDFGAPLIHFWTVNMYLLQYYTVFIKNRSPLVHQTKLQSKPS